VLACLYDVHGNLPALEAVLADAEAAGVTRYWLGGDYALFGAWPAETVERLRGLDNAMWIRGNGERWTREPDAAPDDPVVQGAIAAAQRGIPTAALSSARASATREPAATGSTARLRVSNTAARAEPALHIFTRRDRTASCTRRHGQHGACGAVRAPAAQAIRVSYHRGREPGASPSPRTTPGGR